MICITINLPIYVSYDVSISKWSTLVKYSRPNLVRMKRERERKKIPAIHRTTEERLCEVVAW